uniref:Uncharacterized protein n=1 Tax=Arundo donax TaxID=35708 RepID=A0A0A9FLE7_ARUDO
MLVGTLSSIMCKHNVSYALFEPFYCTICR